MQVSITGRHVDLTDSLKAYVEEKLQHLDHSFDYVLDIHVVVSVQKFHQRCEITVQGNGVSLHASHETEDMYASIDGVVDKLNRQLKRYRAKLRKHQTQHGQRRGREFKLNHSVVAFSQESEEIHEDTQPEVVQHESLAAKPLSVDEAVMQLDLDEKQTVLVFLNQDTDQLNVVYRRQEGGFSWIELNS